MDEYEQIASKLEHLAKVYRRCDVLGIAATMHSPREAEVRAALTECGLISATIHTVLPEGMVRFDCDGERPHRRLSVFVVTAPRRGESGWGESGLRCHRWGTETTDPLFGRSDVHQFQFEGGPLAGRWIEEERFQEVVADALEEWAQVVREFGAATSTSQSASKPVPTQTDIKRPNESGNRELQDEAKAKREAKARFDATFSKLKQVAANLRAGKEVGFDLLAETYDAAARAMQNCRPPSGLNEPTLLITYSNEKRREIADDWKCLAEEIMQSRSIALGSGSNCHDPESMGDALDGFDSKLDAWLKPLMLRWHCKEERRVFRSFVELWVKDEAQDAAKRGDLDPFLFAVWALKAMEAGVQKLKRAGAVKAWARIRWGTQRFERFAQSGIGGGEAPNVDPHGNAMRAVVKVLSDATALNPDEIRALVPYLWGGGRTGHSVLNNNEIAYQRGRDIISGREVEVAEKIILALRRDPKCAVVARDVLAAWDLERLEGKPKVPHASGENGTATSPKPQRKRRRSPAAKIDKHITAAEFTSLTAVSKHGGNVAAAARDLGRDPKTIRQNTARALEKTKGAGRSRSIRGIRERRERREIDSAD